MVKKIAKVVASTILYAAVFGLIGGTVSFIFDVLEVGAAVEYVLWAVLGIFCGLLSYMNGGEILSGESQGDWAYRKDAARTGLLVVVIELFTLIALSVLPVLLAGDSLSRALTFFVAVFLAALFGHAALRPKPKES